MLCNGHLPRKPFIMELDEPLVLLVSLATSALELK